MPKPHITRRHDGEYSTMVLPSGTIETFWFGDDGSEVFVNRTMPESLATVAERHIRTHENGGYA